MCIFNINSTKLKKVGVGAEVEAVEEKQEKIHQNI